uniref:Protein RFT1 homolog n=1 Tax=Aceria tosichella TaxID=561515 RepID=A0A6G1SCC7_9ACAR
MSTNKQLEAAGTSIAFNILVQVLSRSFTFVLKAVTLKYLQSSALLGIINVRLALLYTTLQFLSREPFRRACIGEIAKSDSKRFRKIVNTIWLGFLASILLAFPLAHIWQLNSPPVEDLVGTRLSDYHTAVLIICLAVIVEMIAEPCFIYAQAKAISDHNPKVEVTSVTINCVLTALITVIESSRYKSGESTNILTKITLCQLTASLVSVVYSYARLRTTARMAPIKFFPTLLHRKKDDDETSFTYRNLDRISLKVSSSFLLQTFLKQLLTEGERFVMTFFNVMSLSEQGIYDVVNNLGSLAARLVFKPIEDSGYTLFSQTVSRVETLDIRKFYRVQENLMYLIKSMLLIGLIVLTFGYNFVPLIVLYGGEKLNNAIAFRLMRWQLFYTPLLAVNGVTECFTFAIMDSSEIRAYNYCMVLFSFVFLVSIYIFQSSLGSASFILANCIIMTLRILFSHIRIRKYFEKHGYRFKILEALPNLTTVISLTGVFVFLSVSQHYLLDMLQPISVVFGLILGGWCFVFIIHVIMCHEEDLLNFASRLFKLKSML